jgi:hypothetical protein
MNADNPSNVGSNMMRRESSISETGSIRRSDLINSISPMFFEQIFDGNGGTRRVTSNRF